MGRRVDVLQPLLKEILGSDNVYYQPPEDLKIQYPAIVYQRDYADTKHADNNPYSHTRRYQVTFISRNPDDEVTTKLDKLPMCTFQRFFAADNLNHDVYQLYFKE